MKILITGGAGYIGSHTAVQAINAGHEVVIIDNLINSSKEAIKRVTEITGSEVDFINGDIRNSNLLDELFTRHAFDVVIHFAGLKAVGESHQKPLEYYETNVNGTLQLVRSMTKHGIRKLIFSSSATVYGEEASVPYVEKQNRGKISSPYGTSKAMVEQILEDLAKSDTAWSVILLRYFNPIGAHPSGQIGEDPKGTPNNLMPFITQVAAGKRAILSVFGDDYPTTDGTCERDYLHVMDLANGHIKSLNKIHSQGCHIYNLGTGNPISVIKLVSAFEEQNKIKIPYQITTRRNGDLPAFWADTSKAKNELNWVPELTIDDMVRDSWKWQKMNPDGYK